MQVEKTKFIKEKAKYSYFDLKCGDAFTWGSKKELRIKMTANFMFNPYKNAIEDINDIWEELDYWPELELCRVKLLVDGLD